MQTREDIRVAHIIDSLNAGGAEQMAVSIVNGLKKAEINVCLIVSRTTGILIEKLNDCIPVCFVNKKNSIDFLAFIRLIKIIRDRKIGIIHAHSSSVIWATGLKLIFNDIKIVWHDHYGKSEQLKSRKSFIYKLCSGTFSHTFVVNDNLAAWALNKLNIPQRKITILNNFVSYSAVRKINELEDSKFKKAINIVCVANIRPEKDHNNLLHAFALAAAQQDNIILHLIGLAPDNNYSKGIMKNIREHQFKDRIYYWGQQTQVFSWLQYMDIGILSSQSEGLPLALLEYGLAGLKVISTSVGQISKVLDNGKYGTVLQPQNSALLADEILKILKAPYAASKASAFKKEVEKKYAEEIVIKEIFQVYQSIN